MAEVVLKMRTKFGPAADKAVASTKKISNGFKTVGTRVKAAASKVKAGFSKMGASAKRAAAAFKASRLAQVASLTAVIALVTKSISLFKVQEQAEAKLAAALVNTGKFRTQLFTQLKKQASAQQEVIGVGDEEILQAQSLFIAFGAQTDKIDGLVEATANLAKSQGMDFKAASSLMSKTLGGNISALSRYGIQIDKAAFKTDAAGAVVSAVDSKFKGFARAVNETESGALERLGRRFGDLLETFAKTLLKSDAFRVVMERLSGVVENGTSTISDFDTALQFAFAVASKVGDILRAVGTKISLIVSLVQTLVAGFKFATASIFGTKEEAKLAGDNLDLMILKTGIVFDKVIEAEKKAYDFTKFFEIGKARARAQTTAEAELNATREEAARRFAEEGKRRQIQATIDLQNQASGGGGGGAFDPGVPQAPKGFRFIGTTGQEVSFGNPRTGEIRTVQVTVNTPGVVDGNPSAIATFGERVADAAINGDLNNLGGSAGIGQTGIMTAPRGTD